MVSGTSSRGKLPTAEGRRPSVPGWGQEKERCFFYSLSEKPEVMEAEHVKTLMGFSVSRNVSPVFTFPVSLSFFLEAPG